MFEDIRAWTPDLLDGLRLTVTLTIVSMALAMVLGLILALGRIRPRRGVAYWASTIFVELIRGSPLLLQLFYIYYVFPFIGIRMTPIAAGVLGLTINYSAYLSEVFRAGIIAVDKGQWEAADAIGLRPWLIMRLVVLPQAIRIVVPPVGNYFVSLFKDTALVSTISIGELIFRGQLIAADTFKYLEVYTIIFVIYVAISLPASLGVKAIERRLQSSAPMPRALRG
ncbi:amino acid ABC transporter permease [Limobrevibacterium gyesilva]|uniref:Glutamate/aspartate import permease protein GltK n=1 Tax=Limobrevibacterium gyesilva TaxID=2991712 RepID=A0AA41YQ56_9PROT|nr:amino acid ABC transporter permease [Limobrevibacterium gyesilva]MCW3476233.1 amino acid ABC transporter permease [Limobrevibacterium gyesilva]